MTATAVNVLGMVCLTVRSTVSVAAVEAVRLLCAGGCDGAILPAVSAFGEDGDVVGALVIA